VRGSEIEREEVIVRENERVRSGQLLKLLTRRVWMVGHTA
jgi:hypothetical protein